MMDDLQVANVLDEYKINKELRADDTKNLSQSNNADKVEKCARKGDTICVAKAENISMLERRLPRSSEKPNSKIGLSSIKSSIDEKMQNFDEILSGESLYKTYTFKQSPNDEETEKCIAFWKTVLEKNLKPIKCTIIENSRNRQAAQNVKTDQVVSDVKNERKSCDDQKNEVEKVHEEYGKMWLSALNEIKRKKLHEIELIGKSRCKVCESLTQSVKDDPCESSQASIKQELRELNDWQPKSTGKRLSSKVEPKQSPNQTPASRGSEEDVRNSAAEVKIIDYEINRIEKNGSNDSKKYKYTNVIEEKKKTGAYSEWRKNMLKSACPCEYSLCSCNTNPAVISVERIQTSPASEQQELSEDLPGMNKSESKSAVQKMPKDEAFVKERPDKLATERMSIMGNRKNRESTRVTRALSLMLRCPCGHSSCDCHDTREYISRTFLGESDKVEKDESNHRYSGILSRSSITSSSTRGSVQISEKVITHENLDSLHSDDDDDDLATDEAVDNPQAPSPTETRLDEYMNKSLTQVDSVEVIRKKLSGIDSSVRVSTVMRKKATDPDTIADRSKSLTRVDSVEVIRRRISSTTPNRTSKQFEGARTTSVQVLYDGGH